MRQTKKEILEFIGSVGMASHYQITCLRNVKTRKEPGYNRLTQVARHIRSLVGMKLITARPIPTDSLNKLKYRYQYYELTRKGANLIDKDDYKPRGRFSPDLLFAHQYGLQTIVCSIRHNCDFPQFSVDYPIDKKELGYRPDAIIDTGKGKLIIEHEKSRSMDEMVKVILKRDETVNFSKLPKGSKFIYVINVNRHKNFVDPVGMYHHKSEYEKSVKQFMTDLVNQPKIRVLPSWKYRFQVLHNFEKFGEGVWFAPGKKEKFKI